MTNDQMTLWGQPCRLHSLVSQATRLPLQLVRHSTFVILSALILMLMAKITQAESPSLIGRWNVEIAFADGKRYSLRLDAQGEGKGSLLLVDPRSSAPAADVNWSKGEGNSVEFSGPGEFPIGNVGRDAGTLVFKGKFETPEVITGDVEFSPLVGDRPSKHGTFKATRARE